MIARAGDSGSRRPVLLAFLVTVKREPSDTPQICFEALML
jgi:hypothetical protein